MADLSELRAIPAARARLDAAELALIDQARRDGATWADIAEALGLASRQAAEQRRLRLATTALRAPAGLDDGYGERIAALRAAAVDLHRRIGADRRWDRRFTRAALVRETLAAAHDAPAGSLFALVKEVVGDLEAVPSGVTEVRSRPSPSGLAGAVRGTRPAGVGPSARDGEEGTAVGVPWSGGRSPDDVSYPSSAAGPAAPAVTSGRRVRPALPGPTRAAVDRLRAALAAAVPHT